MIQKGIKIIAKLCREETESIFKILSFVPWKWDENDYHFLLFYIKNNYY